ncbi:MAG: sulfatase [Myxococcota bacterium]
MAVVALLVTLMGACARPPSAPDVVLISIDSLRADHLGAYGYARPTSPFLDRLAREGLRYTDARTASPWTLPSHLTMLTGMWPTDHQVVEDDLALRSDVPMVQERLREAGWATAGFVSTVYVARPYGFARGFDVYEDYGITQRTNLAHAVRADRLVADALAWGKTLESSRPAFLFVHVYDTHYPYLPPKPWDTRFDRAGSAAEARYRTYAWYAEHPLPKARMDHQVAQYDESIAFVDDELRRLAEGWKALGRDATFVVTADHGEELGERGSWGHAHTLYAEAMRVPLIVSGARVSPGVRDERVGTVDLAATIAAMAGLPWDGPGVDVRGAVPARPMLAETSRFSSARLSLLDGRWRLDLNLVAGTRELYDVVADPGEAAASADAATADSMERALWAALGEPWTLNEGAVATSGFLWRDGALAGKRLDTPGPFGMYPPDATVNGAIRGVVEAGSRGDVTYGGPRRAAITTIPDATRQQLEELGYLQGPE